jgi:hypothetical protein
MAARKRRNTTRRTTTRARANPSPRRRTNRHRRTRRRNPIVVARANRFHRRRRRSNPSSLGGMKGLFTGAVFVAAGTIGTQFAAGFIPVLPFGQWGVLAAKAGAAYGVGIIAHKLGVSQQNAALMTLGGLAGVAQDAFAILRNKFPDILQARAVQVPQGAAVVSQAQIAAASAAAVPARSSSGDDMYGGMNDITFFPRAEAGGLWGRGSGMGDVVLYGRP